MSAIQLKLGPRPIGMWPLGAILALPLMLLPLGGWLVESDTMVLARCTFKSMLGIPCMGCGGTRATLNFLHGDLAEAFLFSPLVALAWSALIAWGLLSFALYISGKRLELEMNTPLTWLVRGLLISLPFVNWIYLMVTDL